MENIINLIFLVVSIIIFSGILVKFFQKEKTTPAVVLNKQCLFKQVVRKSQAPFLKKEYIITFKCGNKKLNFEVSEISYNNYRINQKGILKYKGNRLIDFG